MGTEKRLTKKERKQRQKEEKLQKKQQVIKASMQWKWFFIGAVMMIILGGVSLVLYLSVKGLR